MTIASELEALQTNLNNAYTAIENKGGTLPEVRSFENLSLTIDDMEVQPNLQEKIARQNGVVEPDSEYDGLSSVDVMVGQIGETYEANNKTGSALVANQKVWLNYREPTAGSVTTIASETSTDNGFAGFGCAISPDGSYIYYINGFRRLNAYNVSTGNNTDQLASFDATYCLYALDDGTQLINHKSGTLKLQANTATSYSSYVQKYHNIRMSGSTIGVLVNGSWVSYSGSATAYNGVSCSALVNGQPMLYFIYNSSSRYYISKPVFNDSDHTYSVLNYVDLGTSNVNAKAIGSTNDGKYVIFGSSAMPSGGYSYDFTIYKVNQETGGLSSFSPNTTGFNSLVAPKCAIFDNFNNILSCCDSSGHSAVIKYNPTNDTWEDVTISGYSGTVKGPLWLSSDRTLGAGRTGYNGFSGYRVYKYAIANSGGWDIIPYSYNTSNSLTGYASETIPTLTSGNVIVGTKIEPTLSTLNVTPTTSAQSITPTSPDDGFDEVNVSAVTASIDQNISAENIKKDVVILGITGSYEGSGGTLVTKTITENGTYNASSDSADGYSEVTVNVPGVDIITATNTTGASIASGDKVWLERQKESITDFSTSGNVTINGTEASISSYGSYIYKYFSSFTTPSEYIEIQIKSKFMDADYDGCQARLFGSPEGSVSNNIQFSVRVNGGGLTISTPGDHSTRLIYGGSTQTNTWYITKIRLTNSSCQAWYSTDGTTWIGPTNVNYPPTIASCIQRTGFSLYCEGNHAYYDIAECYVKADGVTWWKPLSYDYTGWNVLSYSEITKDSFTGIAQETIANGSSGSVKTVLPQQ